MTKNRQHCRLLVSNQHLFATCSIPQSPSNLFSYSSVMLGMARFRAVIVCQHIDLGKTGQRRRPGARGSFGFEVGWEELLQKTSKEASSLAGGVLPIPVESIP